MNTASIGDSPFFSVVIPLYNKAAFIASTLESVMEQDFDDFEVIVVDDGSTDGSANIVERLGRSDSRIRLIRLRNGGVSSARNHGIDACRSDFICFLDADDQWEPVHLANIRDLISKYSQAGLFFDQCAVRKNGKLIADSWLGRWGYRDGLLPSYPQAMTISPNIINSSNVVVRSQCFDTDRFVESDSVGEDLDLWLRLSARYPVAFCTEVGAIYNRDTVDNARTYNSVFFPKGYFATINRLSSLPDISSADRDALLHVRDRKMVAFAFSLINSGDITRARSVLRSWEPRSRYAFCKPFLQIATRMPRSLVETVGDLRMRIS